MYKYLNTILPELVKETTAFFFNQKTGSFSKGTYALLEMYCADKNCDCRRVFLNVVHEETKQFIVQIAFGWESKEFYAKWFGCDEDYSCLEDMAGWEILQAPLGKKSVEMFELLMSHLKNDKDFIAKTKRHYQAFKKIINK